MLIVAALIVGGYTNFAGNVVAGWPVGLTYTHVVLSEQGTNRISSGAAPAAQGTTYPLSIFPESERRRIAADFGQPRLPKAVKRAIAGAEKAITRSRRRAEQGLCTKEESAAFGEKTSAALRSYLDRQVESGAITPAERKSLGR